MDGVVLAGGFADPKAGGDDVALPGVALDDHAGIGLCGDINFRLDLDEGALAELPGELLEVAGAPVRRLRGSDGADGGEDEDGGEGFHRSWSGPRV